MIKFNDIESTIMYMAKGYYDNTLKNIYKERYKKMSYIEYLEFLILAYRKKYYVMLSDKQKMVFYFLENLINLCTKLGYFENQYKKEKIFSAIFFVKQEFDPESINNQAFREYDKTDYINYRICLNMIKGIFELIGNEKIFEDGKTVINLEPFDEKILVNYIEYIKQEKSKVNNILEKINLD